MMFYKINALFFAKLDNVFSLSSEIIIKFFFVKKELKKLEFIIVSFVFPDLEIIKNRAFFKLFSFLIFSKYF